MRKFERSFDYYSGYAKKNYKLKLALFSAAQQLKQNSEDISYFDLSSNIKRKPGRPRKDDKYDKEKEIEIEKIEKIEKCQQSIQESVKNNQILIDVIPKKRPGRPRKYYSEQKPKEQNNFKIKQNRNDHTESKQQPQIKDKISDKQQSQAQSLNKINKPINSFESQQKQPSHRQKDIIKITRLFERSLYKEIVCLLQRIKIGNDNIQQLLELGIVGKLEKKLGGKIVKKIKDKVKKALIHKYFKFSGKNKFNLLTLTRYSSRSKLVRKLNVLFKRIYNGESKTQALKAQLLLRQAYIGRDEMYMRQAISMIEQLQIKSQSQTDFTSKNPSYIDK